MRLAALVFGLLAIAACGIEDVEYDKFKIGCAVGADCPTNFFCDGRLCHSATDGGGGGVDDDSDGQSDEPAGGGMPDLGGIGEPGKLGGECLPGDRCGQGLVCIDDACKHPAAAGGA